MRWHASEELGDPQEALSAFVRANLDRDALILAYEEMFRADDDWLESEADARGPGR